MDSLAHSAQWWKEKLRANPYFTHAPVDDSDWQRNFWKPVGASDGECTFWILNLEEFGTIDIFLILETFGFAKRVENTFLNNSEALNNGVFMNKVLNEIKHQKIMAYGNRKKLLTVWYNLLCDLIDRLAYAYVMMHFHRDIPTIWNHKMATKETIDKSHEYYKSLEKNVHQVGVGPRMLIPYQSQSKQCGICGCHEDKWLLMRVPCCKQTVHSYCASAWYNTWLPTGFKPGQPRCALCRQPLALHQIHEIVGLDGPEPNW